MKKHARAFIEAKSLQQRSQQHEETAHTGHGERGVVDGGSASASARARAGGSGGAGARAAGAGGVDVVVAASLVLNTSDLLAGVVVDLLGDGLARDSDGGAGGGVGETVLDVVRDLGGSLGQVPRVKEALGSDEASITLRSVDAGLGLVVGGDTVHVNLGELLLEVVEVDQGGNGVAAVDLDETVVVVSLGELVDETTGEGLGHLLAVQSLDFRESTRSDLVATVLREENGQSSVGEVLNQDVVAARLVSSITAPGVGVETKEIELRVGVIKLTLEVGSGRGQDRTNVGSRVTDGDRTVRVLGDVLLHVTNNGTNVGGDRLDGILVDDLVTGEETQNVVEVLEGLDDTEDLLVVFGIVGVLGRSTVQGAVLERRVDIKDHVDTGGVEDGGTLVVVKRGRQVVDTDGVDLSRRES